MPRVVGIWKKEIKSMDRLEKRNYLKEIFAIGHWEFLRDCSEDLKDEELTDCLSEIYGPGNILAPNKKELKDLLLECAKENISNSKELIKKLNKLLGLDS